MNWYIGVLKKYAVFEGRARRAEYWYFVLFNFIAAVILAILDHMLGTLTATGMGIFGLIYGLAVIMPGIAVSVRRLHDTDRSGWWMFLFLIPLLGPLVLLVFMVLDSTPGENRFGPNPKE